MTLAGQAITLQMSSICDSETVRTRAVRPKPESRALGITGLLVAR